MAPETHAVGFSAFGLVHGHEAAVVCACSHLDGNAHRAIFPRRPSPPLDLHICSTHSTSHASHASHARPEVLSGLFCVVVAIATVLTAWNVRTAAICRRDVKLAPLGVPTSRPAGRPSQGLLGAVVMGAHVFSPVLELAHTPQTHLPFSPPQNFQKSKRAEFRGFLRGWCARSEL